RHQLIWLEPAEIELTFRAPAGCAAGDGGPEFFVQPKRDDRQLFRFEGGGQVAHRRPNVVERVAEFAGKVTLDAGRLDGIVLDYGADAGGRVDGRHSAAA